MPKKLFGAARFPRQCAICTCFYAVKRAAKTAAKTFVQEGVFSNRRQTVGQSAHVTDHRGLFTVVGVIPRANYKKGIACKSPD
jgi:hypothetical protein